MLRVERLSKTYGSMEAVRDLSFDVLPGEVVGLLGRNGAGKTTCISCICGLQRPDEGRVEILGVDALADPTRAHRGLALATQDVALYPGFKVSQNLAFLAALGGGRRREVTSAIADVTRLLQLENLLDERVAELSGGQRRIVHVAAALIGRPALVVLDEPTSGLDVEARTVLLSAIRSLAGSGIGFLFSSHYLPEAERVCDRVVIVEKGRLAASGTIRECIEKYGRPTVEIRVDGELCSYDGSNVSAAVAALDPGRRARIDSLRVTGNSLESVFRRVTGLDDVSSVAGADR